jgi:hypothetical protein
LPKTKIQKKGDKDSFYLEGSLKIKGNRIKLPRIGWADQLLTKLKKVHQDEFRNPFFSHSPKS